MSETNIDLVLDQIGVGRTQICMLLTCGIICVYIANESIGIGLIAVAIVCDFKMTNVQIALLSSAAFAGLVLSSHYWGYLTDRYGRRKEMLFSLGLSLISSFLSISMPEVYSFTLARFLLGLFMSGAVTNTITYMTEFATIKTRPLVINFMSYAFPLGTIYVSAMAHVLKPLNRLVFSMGSFDVCVWRMNLVLHAAPGILAFAALWQLPESAKYMLSVGKPDLAYEILDRLCFKNHGKDLKSLGITSVTQPNLRTEIKESENWLKRLWHDTVPLFKPPYLKSYMLCTLCICAFFFVGNGLTLWFINMIQDLKQTRMILCDVIELNAKSKGGLQCDKEISYLDGIFLGCTFLACCMGVSFLLMFMHRSHVMFTYSLLATLCGIGINFFKIRGIILTAMLLFLSLSSASMPLAASVISDCVPTHLRGKAISMSFMFARLTVVFANIIIGTCMSTHCLIAFNIFVVIMFAVTVLTCFTPK